MKTILCILALAGFCAITDSVTAQDSPAAKTEAKKVPAQKELFQKFEQQLTGSKFTGKFTVVGKPNKGLSEETYEIESVQKLDDGDYWLFKARIKYGDNDIVVPMPLQVKWAGDTPVITLTEMTIPGLGTFSARVLIHNDWYAGTWVHGKAGGHLFGTISQQPPEQKPVVGNTDSE